MKILGINSILVKEINDKLCGQESEIYVDYNENIRKKYKDELEKIQMELINGHKYMLGPFSSETLNRAPKHLIIKIYNDQIKIIRKYSINI